MFSETMNRIFMIAFLGLAYFAFTQHRKASDLEEQLSFARFQAEQTQLRLEQADERVKAEAAARVRKYEESLRLLGEETADRDGTVAPALRDAIGRLP